MEKFDLSIWLQDKSRKICTRDGREVTIEKTDIHIHGMSHMILGKYSDIYEIWHSNGRINYTGSDCNLDLFFSDEELVPIQDTKAYQEGVKEGRRLEREDLEKIIEDKVAEKVAELLNNLPTQSPLQPNPYPNPLQPTSLLYGCPTDYPDITYTKTQARQ